MIQILEYSGRLRTGWDGVGSFKREMVADLFGKDYEVGFCEE